MSVRDLRPGERVEDYFALRKMARREYTGGERLSLELGDASGRVEAVMWDGYDTVIDELKVGTVVKVRGLVGSYQDRPQIRVEKIRPALADEVTPADFIPRVPVAPEELERRLDAALSSITDEHLVILMQGLLGEGELREQFLTVPGAKLWHHNAIGGLAEHSLNLVSICQFACTLYPDLNSDILICGALLHDIGKVEQYEVGAMIDFSDEGRLVGHINSGDYRVTAAMRAIDGFPAETERVLRHLILSHQGSLEHGSPVVPQMPEAFVLYYADEIDSKMGALRHVADKTGDADWSEWVKLIGRYIYFGHNRTGREDRSG